MKAADTQNFETEQGQQSSDDPSGRPNSAGEASQNGSSYNGQSEDWSVVSDRAGSRSRDRAGMDSDSAGVRSGTDGEWESDEEGDEKKQNRKSKTLLGTLGAILPGKH